MLLFSSLFLTLSHHKIWHWEFFHCCLNLFSVVLQILKFWLFLNILCHISAFIRLSHYGIIALLCLHFPNKTTVSPAPGRVPGTSGCFSNSLLKKIRMNSRIALLMYAKGITTSANLSRVINIKERGKKFKTNLEYCKHSGLLEISMSTIQDCLYI